MINLPYKNEFESVKVWPCQGRRRAVGAWAPAGGPTHQHAAVCPGLEISQWTDNRYNRLYILNILVLCPSAHHVATTFNIYRVFFTDITILDCQFMNEEDSEKKSSRPVED